MFTGIQDLLKELQTNGTDPIWWKRLVRRRLVGQLYYGIRPNDGVYVMNEDWDTLIILDACRYDLFKQILSEQNKSLVSQLEARISRGTSTKQFLAENFSAGQYNDTVYVTANPWVNVELNNPFHALVSVWDDGWSEASQTVLPETVYDRAIEIADDYPNKRLIVHFMQPHYPFIGCDIIDEANISWKNSRSEALGVSPENDDASVWNLLERGEVDRNTVLDAYADNLSQVLPYALDLAENITGRSIITSDHGNGIGEFCWPFPVRVYGHPRNIRVRPVVRVPWLPIEGDTRPEIRDESRDSTDEFDNDVVMERLQNLGYKA